MANFPFQCLKVVSYAPGWGFGATQWHNALDRAEAIVRLKGDASGAAGVWRATVTLDGREHDIVIKIRPLDSLRRTIQSFVGLSQHARQWRGARRLAENHIACAACVARLRAHTDDCRCELLILKAIPGETVLSLLQDGRLAAACERELAHALGCVLRTVQECGLLNRDSKPSNLVADWHENHCRITVIDTVAIERARPTEAGLVRMLRDLALEPLASGCFPRRTLAMRVVASAAGQVDRSYRKHLWRACLAEIRRHENPVVQAALVVQST